MQETVAVTTADFEKDVLASEVPVLVKFGAAWCPPCRRIAPEVEAAVAPLAGKVRVLSLDVEESQEVAGRYGIQGIPVLLMFKAGQVVDEVRGFAPRTRIAQMLEAHV